MRLNEWRQSLSEVPATPMAPEAFGDRCATGRCKGGIGRGGAKISEQTERLIGRLLAGRWIMIEGDEARCHLF